MSAEVYGRDYYQSHCGSMPYVRNAHWLWFFGRMADELIRSFAPRRVIDAGCALGFLVECFADLGVAAHGRDISAFAWSQIRADIRPCCQLGSISEPIEPCDLITCIEVLEHMPPDEAIGAIAAMTAAAPRIVFSSTPSAVAEPTHINVRPTLYWLQQFAACGFLPLARYDASYIAPHAFVLERAVPDAERFDLEAFAGLIRLRMMLTDRESLVKDRESDVSRLQAVVADMAAERNDIAASRARAARAEAALEVASARIEQAETAAEEARQAAELARLQRDRVVGSTIWRLMWPVRAAGELAKAPLRITARTLRPPPPPPPPLVLPAALADLAATTALETRFDLLQPLVGFAVAGTGTRVTIVTDSINANSLYGGVGTALILGALIARRLDGGLRLVTRDEPQQPGVVRRLLDLHGIAFAGNIEFLSGNPAPITDDDVFLTTSWWSTWSTRQTVKPRQILYLLQEDERMFYPRGDDFLRCSEVLADHDLRVIVNSRLLFDHLADIPAIAERGVWFEPAFPAQSYRPRTTPAAQREFLFYARPGNPRNLYWRGLEAIIAALDTGVLNADRWNLHFVGRAIGDVKLPHGIRPILHENLAWADYAALVGTIDVGLSLMHTPHPSYPPLDLAASGAVVVTNQCDGKTSLDRYSRNIICVPPTVAALTQGLAAAIRLADDTAARAANYAAAGLGRDWNASFEAVLDRLFG